MEDYCDSKYILVSHTRPLKFPTPSPRSFTRAICRAVSLTLVPRSLLLNRTETLAMLVCYTAVFSVVTQRIA